jgi:PKD repeat protein
MPHRQYEAQRMATHEAPLHSLGWAAHRADHCRGATAAGRIRSRLVPLAVVTLFAGTALAASGLGGLPAQSSASTHAFSMVPSVGLPAAPIRPHGHAGTGARTDSAIPFSSSFGWQNVSSVPMPGNRYGPAMAYDAAAGYTVLFGGFHPVVSGEPTPLNDTWTFENGTWSNVTASAGPAPPGRSYASMVWDSRDGYLLLLGGKCSAGPCTDAWMFTGGAWGQIASPPAVLNQSSPSAVYDSSDGYVLATTCDPPVTWAYSGGVWTNHTVPGSGNNTTRTPPDCGGTLVDDPANLGVQMFGGLEGGRALTATWLYQGGNWTNISGSAGTPPPPASGLDGEPGVACYDPIDGSVVYVTANYEPRPASLVATYLFNGTWSNVTGALAPPLSSSPTLAWDGADQACLLADTVYANVWEWTGHPAMADLSVAESISPADSGAPVTFSSTFLGGVGPFAYNWSFGDGSSSPLSNPIHAYAVAGNYTVNLTVTDTARHSACTSIVFVVSPALSSLPFATPNPTEAGVPTNFSATVGGGTGSTRFDWTFGDGSSSVSADPVHTYSRSGNFSVGLNVTDAGGGLLTTTFSLSVAPAVNVSIRVLPVGPALGQLANFSAIVAGGIGPYQYAWAFGDGGTGGDLANISHVYATNGPFTATVIVTDGIGGVAQRSVGITVALNLSILGSWTLGAAPLQMSFTSQIQGGDPGFAYSWEFGDGSTDATASPTHTYRTPGFYTAVLTVRDSAGDIAQASWASYVAPGGGPLGVTLIASPTTLPDGGSTVVTAVPSGGSGGYSLAWTTGSAGCSASGLLAQTCAPPTSGSYPVTVDLSDSSGTHISASVEVIVGASSTTSPAFTLGPDVPIAALAALIGGAVVLGAQFARSRWQGSRSEGRGPSNRPGPGGPDGGPEGAPTGEEDPFDDLV